MVTKAEAPRSKRKKSPLPALRKRLWSGNLTPHTTTPTSFNPCLISDEHQLSLLVKQILNEVSPQKEQKRVRKDRPSKIRDRYKKTITTFLLNCTGSFVFLLDDQELNLSKFRNHCHVHPKSRYPELRPHQQVIKLVVDRLHDRGLIDRKKGSSKLEKSNGQWMPTDSIPTFIHPSIELTEFIKLCKVAEEKELIQIKQEIDGEKYLVDYKDTENMAKERGHVAQFNHFRTKHTYTLNGEDFIPKPIYRSYRTFNIDRGYITPDKKPLLLGGRFQGGITQMWRDDRKRILIDGEDTVEVDFSHMHISLAYKKFLGVDVEEPYTLYPYQSDELRKIIKKVVNIALNVSPDDNYSGPAKVRHELKKIIDEDNETKQKYFEESGYSQSALKSFTPELEIPFYVYDNLTEAGREQGGYYYNAAPDPDEGKCKCDYSLSRIIRDTIEKHETVLNMAWSTKNVGLGLQKIESDIMYSLMTNEYAMHQPQSRTWHNDKDFTFNTWHESYVESNCIFEPIHDGLLIKKKWANSMKKLMESTAKKYGFNLIAEIKN